MPRSSPDVPPTQIQVGFGDRVGIGMKGQYTPKIGDEFEIVAIEVVEASSPTPETIREYTRAAIALLTVVATAVVLDRVDLRIDLGRLHPADDCNTHHDPPHGIHISLVLWKDRFWQRTPQRRTRLECRLRCLSLPLIDWIH